MTIELTPESEAIVLDQINSGRYSSANAVIEEALHAVHGLRGEESQERLVEQQAKANQMDDLFARIDAEGITWEDFYIERDRRPAEERELW